MIKIKIWQPPRGRGYRSLNDKRHMTLRSLMLCPTFLSRAHLSPDPILGTRDVDRAHLDRLADILNESA